MVIEYGFVEKEPVYIMKKATKKHAPKGHLVVGLLKTGQSLTIKKTKLKKRTKKYPLRID